MKTWIRNIAVSVALKYVKNSKYGIRVLDWLRGHKTNVGRVLMALTSVAALLQYFFPGEITNELIVAFGAAASFIMIEIGLEDKIQESRPLTYDPTKTFDINLGGYVITIPPMEDLDTKEPLVNRTTEIGEETALA